MIRRWLIVVLLINAVIDIGGAQAESSCEDREGRKASLYQTYIAGSVFEALEGYEALADCPDLGADERISLYLRLARVHDRIGLHWNTRPVLESWEYISRAEALAGEASAAGHAQVDLELANYYYRAETPEDGYPRAFEYAKSALKAYEGLGDFQGQADAVHRMGLLHMQMRELVKAREYFDLSLKLENSSSDPRSWMLSDYERHVGFVLQMSGRQIEAIPYFERSFDIRRGNGFADAAMYAATSLARILVDNDRTGDARQYIDYALQVAKRIDSPEGFIRAGLVQADVYLAKERWDVAGETLERILRIAKGINRASVIERVETQLEQIAHLRTSQTSSHEH